MGRECQGPEQIGEGGIAHIKPAGERTEGRHHHSRLVRSKASAADSPATMGNSCNRMKMAADFARRPVWQGTKRQRPCSQCIGEAAANTVRRLGIMIASDPDPFATALHHSQVLAIAFAKPGGSIAVVEAVAEGHNAARR